MNRLTSTDAFDAVLEQPLAIVYKHSTRCPISVLAADEVARFEEEHPDVPVYVVDVVADRPVSRHVAAALEVTHHSPQVIVVAQGRPAWHASHFDVRAEVLAERLEALAGSLSPER
jgi:bacillithiol system protein YtxJ